MPSARPSIRYTGETTLELSSVSCTHFDGYLSVQPGLEQVILLTPRFLHFDDLHDH